MVCHDLLMLVGAVQLVNSSTIDFIAKKFSSAILEIMMTIDFMSHKNLLIKFCIYNSKMNQFPCL